MFELYSAVYQICLPCTEDHFFFFIFQMPRYKNRYIIGEIILESSCFRSSAIHMKIGSNYKTHDNYIKVKQIMNTVK